MTGKNNGSDTDRWGRKDWCLRLPLRYEHRRHCRCRPGRRVGRRPAETSRRSYRPRLQIHVLQPGTGIDREGYQGAGLKPRYRGRLLPPFAREDFPHRLLQCRTQSISVRDGFDPRAGFVGAYRQGRRDRKSQSDDLRRSGASTPSCPAGSR